MPISSILFTSTLVLGTITSLTAPNWLIAWLGIEINLLSFIPLISYHPINPSTDKTTAACKYFLAQATGSVLFLLGPATWLTPWDKLGPIFLLLALITKAGIAPMFQWFPSIIASLSWTSALILLTWQKLTPLLLLFHLDLPKSITTPIILISVINTLVGAINGLAQTQLRPLLAFSSIAHMGWIFSISPISTPAATGYLIAYIIIVAPILFLLLNGRVTSPKIIPTLKKLAPTQLGLVTLLLLNLAGLPPLGGFCLKGVRLALLANSYPIITLILILSSVATLAFYIHLALLTIVTSFQTLIPSPAPSPIFNLVLSLRTFSATTLPILPLILC